MTFATAHDLYLIEDISIYSNLPNVELQLQRAENRILKLLNQDWYNNFKRQTAYKQLGQLMPDLLNKDQWQKPTIYYALAYLILPKLEQNQQIKTLTAEYHLLWEESYNKLLTFGIDYDSTDSIAVQPNDPVVEYLRLRK